MGAITIRGLEKSFGETTILEEAGRAIEGKQSRGVASFEGALRNLLVWETIIQLIQTHGRRQSTSKSS